MNHPWINSNHFKKLIINDCPLPTVDQPVTMNVPPSNSVFTSGDIIVTPSGKFYRMGANHFIQIEQY